MVPPPSSPPYELPSATVAIAIGSNTITTTGTSTTECQNYRDDNDASVNANDSLSPLFLENSISPNPVLIVSTTTTGTTNTSSSLANTTTGTSGNSNTIKRVEFTVSSGIGENSYTEKTSMDYENVIDIDNDNGPIGMDLLNIDDENVNSNGVYQQQRIHGTTTATTDTPMTTMATATSGSASPGTGAVTGMANVNNSSSAVWDTETDHMLSYFLSGSDQIPSFLSSSIPSSTDFTTTTASGSTSAITMPPTNPLVVVPSTKTTAIDTTGSSRTNVSSTNQSTYNNNDITMPPPTPAVQFFSTSTPLASNVHRRRGGSSNNITNKTSSNQLQNNNSKIQQQQQQQHTTIYPTAMTDSTATQSQSSSSSSLSSLLQQQHIQQSYTMMPIHHSNSNNNIQLYHQQLQMQRMLAGSGGGGGGGSNGSNSTTILQQHQQMLFYPSMMIPSPRNGSISNSSSSDHLTQQLQPLHMYDGESPLSPAAMIGGTGGANDHENLFLPRSNSFYENAVKQQQQQQIRGSADSVSHSSNGVGQQSTPVNQPNFIGSSSGVVGGVVVPPAMGYVWPPPGASGMTAISLPPIPPMPPLSMMGPPFYAANTTTVLQPAAQLLHQQQPQQVPAVQQQQPIVQEEETEEKRNKRLERNRESARKCRLRKKERLFNLGIQVTELHDQIEKERRTIINTIVSQLMQHCRQREIISCITLSDDTMSSKNNMNDIDMEMISSNVNNSNPLIDIVRDTGPSSTMMRSVLEFQYSSLKDIILPMYQKLLLWFTTQKESYYTIGKEQYATMMMEQQKKMQSSSSAVATGVSSSSRPSLLKVSSKQIGEELITGNVNGNGDTKNNDSKSSKKRNSDENKKGTIPSSSSLPRISSSCVYDGSKTWPLFCYELKLSVDQEERFLAKQKQLLLDDDQQLKNIKLAAKNSTDSNINENSSYRSLSYIREQMAIAVSTTEHLGKEIGTLSHLIAQRDENMYINTLNPNQVSQYYRWLSNHREQIRNDCNHISSS